MPEASGGVRIRQVKPAFWTDSTVAALPPAVRLFYIGLWMVADDAGWFRCNVAEIANELYGYDVRSRRERHVAAFLDTLAVAGRIERLDCGHGRVPTLIGHQRFSGPTKQVKSVEREHNDVCLAHSRTSPQVPAIPRPVRNGKERELVGEREQVRNGLGTVHARKRDDESETEFRQRVGIPEFMGGKSA